MIILCALSVIPSVAQGKWEHPWKGKRVAYLGDSVTDPSNNGSEMKYWGFLQQWLDIQPLVYGISGKEWNDIPRQADKLKAEHDNDFDAIIIFMGTNDFNDGIPIGRWYEEKVDPVEMGVWRKVARGVYHSRHRMMSMDQNTYCGRINIAMEKLRRMFPRKQIVLMTPIHRSVFCPEDVLPSPSEAYPNFIGTYFDEYVDKIKEASNVWSVPVIDLNGISGLFPLIDEAAVYFHDTETDRLHPNDEGHARLARTIACQLAVLPCAF